MDMAGSEGKKERVRCMKRVTLKLTLPYVKIDSQWEFVV